MRAIELQGREAELEALVEVTEAARVGTGGTVLLEGEAGIGKTRLIDELSVRARELGMAVHRGAGDALEAGRPFGAIIDALGSPDTSPVRARESRWGTEEASFLVQDAFVDHVEQLTADGLMVLAIDDLHWADRGTLSTLWALARRASDLGLLLVLAYRLTPTPAELRRLIESCDGLGARRVRLGPIHDDALAALATDVLGHRADEEVLGRLEGVGGNPFLAIEVLHLLTAGDRVDATSTRDSAEVDELPPILRETLLGRLTSISETAREMLSVASVLGGNGRVEDLAVLLAQPLATVSTAVSEATRAGLLEPSGETLAFRHDLIREALYQDLPSTVRAGWHRQAARVLGSHTDPAVVARHLSLGATSGDDEVLTELRNAADDLVAREPDAAAELLERALTLARNDALRADLAVTRAEALLAAGRAEDAGEQADRVLALAGIPPAVVARAHLARGEACSHQGRLVQAVESFAAARATGVLDDAAAAYALGRQAENRVWTFQLDAALDEAERALVFGQRLGIAAVVVEALTARSAVLEFHGDLETAIVSGREAVKEAGDDPDALRRTPHAYLGLALSAGDRLDEAREVGEEGRRRSSELGQVLVLPNYQALLARVAWFAGRWDDALAEVETGAALAADFGLRFGLAANQGIRGLVAFHRGDFAEARAVVDGRHAPTRRDTDDASGSELVVLLQAELMAVDGDMTGAAALLRGLFEVERELGVNMARLWPAPACVRFALAAGDGQFADEVADDTAQVAARARTASGDAAAAFTSGLVSSDQSLLEEAATQFEAAGRPLERMEALEAAGLAGAAAGDTAAAEAALRRALEAATLLGAAHDARRILASLRQLGVRVGTREQARRPAHGWDALTDAEQQVARLLAEGLRNAQIADQLYVSRRTVETHVSRLYQKLGAENRVALAAAIVSCR